MYCAPLRLMGAENETYNLSWFSGTSGALGNTSVTRVVGFAGRAATSIDLAITCERHGAGERTEAGSLEGSNTTSKRCPGSKGNCGVNRSRLSLTV